MGTRIVFLVLFLLSSQAFAMSDATCHNTDCLHNGWTVQSYNAWSQVRCTGGDCINFGWTARNNLGQGIQANCNPGGCYTNGWFEFQNYYPFNTFQTVCKPGGCLVNGWSTFYMTGQLASDVTCINRSCARFGWFMTASPGMTVQIQCKAGDCFRYGWTVYP